MRRLMLIAGFSLLVGAAQAGWVVSDVSSDEGEAYKGWSVDFSGDLEAQIYCDDWFPGMIDLTLYTGEEYDADAGYAEDGVLAVTLDGKRRLEITAFYDDHEGEVLVYTSNFDVEGLEDLLAAMSKARRSVDFEYYGRQYSFPAEGLRETLSQMAEQCPTG